MAAPHPLADSFRKFTRDDGVASQNGYVMALEAVLAKCADLRTRGFAQYPDEVAAEFERIFADFFGIQE
jgi:hypothetical protein